MLRTFADATGTEWTVYEVKRQGGTSERWSYLPAQFGDGWLCFESGVAKRRLTPIPAGWRQFSDAQLLRLMDQAPAVPRGRPADDDRAVAE